jgi:hypothetical protein
MPRLSATLSRVGREHYSRGGGRNQCLRSRPDLRVRTAMAIPTTAIPRPTTPITIPNPPRIFIALGVPHSTYAWHSSWVRSQLNLHFDSNRDSNADGRRWTWPHNPARRPRQSHTQQPMMDVRGHSAPPLARTSKPLVGILGDVDGRIVPVAPPPNSEFDSRVDQSAARSRLTAPSLRQQHRCGIMAPDRS